MHIGILGLQGAFVEHEKMLHRLDINIRTSIIREAGQLQDVTLDGLIIPGGESTSMAIIAEKNGMLPILRDWVTIRKGPTMGTCAGLIMLADDVVGCKEGGQALIGGLSCRVHRNAYGSQKDSFIAPIQIHSSIACDGLEMGVFIRAPLIESVNDNVDILAELSSDQEDKKNIIAVRQGNIMGLSFHPELSDSLTWHRYFVNLISKSKS